MGFQRGSTALWTFVITSVGLFMVTLDNLVVTMALPVIRDGPGRVARGASSGRSTRTRSPSPSCCSPAPRSATGSAADGCSAIGMAIFTVASAAAALAPSVEALVAARALQGLGGAIVTPLTLTLLSAAVPPEKRGLALGAWGGIGGLAVALGPARRRRDRRRHLVAVDLLAQRSDRPRAHPARDAPPAREPRPAHEPRPRGPRSGKRRSLRNRLGRRSRQRSGLGLGRGPGRPRSRRRARRRVRPLGAPRAEPDAPDAALQEPDVRRCERHLAVHVLRDVRLDLPARAVPPDRSGLLTARRRSADAPLDGDADVHRSDRRRALRPDRRAPADGHRSRAAGCRARLARGDQRARRRRTASSSRRSSSPASACPCSSPRSRTSSSPRCADRGRGQASGANNAIRELGGVFGVAVLAAVFASYGGYETPQSYVDGLAQPSGSARSSSVSARSPRCSSRGSAAVSPRSERRLANGPDGKEGFGGAETNRRASESKRQIHRQTPENTMTTIEVEQTVREVETEDERVFAWRLESLLRAGYGERLAHKLALRRQVDPIALSIWCAAAAHPRRPPKSCSKAQTGPQGYS